MWPHPCRAGNRESKTSIELNPIVLHYEIAQWCSDAGRQFMSQNFPPSLIEEGQGAEGVHLKHNLGEQLNAPAHLLFR